MLHRRRFLQAAGGAAAFAALRRRAYAFQPSPRIGKFNQALPLIQRLGTNTKRSGSASFGRGYTDPATETPRAGDVEIWRIFNLTGDTHPIHFHLVNVQVLGRRPFNAANYDGTPRFTEPMRGPDPNEAGFKETVRVNPNEMLMAIMKFKLPNVPFSVPMSPRTGGYEYVWHCHILEHEEHDMMRRLVVSP
jgi:spore coat protein A